MLRPTRILYVEDNDYLRDAIAMLIESETREVHTAADAEAAQAALEQVAFDILVSDVNLPGRSGLDLVRQAAREQPQLGLVLCSGHDLVGALAELGPRARVVRKPFEPEELCAVLDELTPSAASGE